MKNENEPQPESEPTVEDFIGVVEEVRKRMMPNESAEELQQELQALREDVIKDDLDEEEMKGFFMGILRDLGIDEDEIFSLLAEKGILE
jgi:beta-N-acetylglucosaminidase